MAPWDKKGRAGKQTLCWIPDCPNAPATTVRLAGERRGDARTVRVCEGCARRIGGMA